MTEASCSSLNDIVPETICDSAGAGILSNAPATGKLPVTIFGAVAVSIIKLLVVETLWSVDGAARGLSGDQYPTGSFLRKRPDAKGPMVRAPGPVSSSTHYIPHWVQTKDGPR
jgi:hypothetical protein